MMSPDTIGNVLSAFADTQPDNAEETAR